MAWDDFRGASQAFDQAVRALHRSEGLAVEDEERLLARPTGEARRAGWSDYHPRLTRAQQARKRRQQEGS